MACPMYVPMCMPNVCSHVYGMPHVHSQVHARGYRTRTAEPAYPPTVKMQTTETEVLLPTGKNIVSPLHCLEYLFLFSWYGHLIFVCVSCDILKSHLTIMHRSLGQISIFSKHLLMRRNTADLSGRLGEKEARRDRYNSLTPAGSQ